VRLLKVRRTRGNGGWLGPSDDPSECVFRLAVVKFLAREAIHHAGLDATLVSGDELIGNIVQVTAYDLWLRADSQHVVADPLD
jgi:hypothetical protein